jgi:hypothetical protein
MPIGREVTDRALQANRHRHVGQRVAAEVGEAQIGVDGRGVDLQHVGEQVAQIVPGVHVVALRQTAYRLIVGLTDGQPG